MIPMKYSFTGNPSQRELLSVHQRPQSGERQRQLQQQRLVGADVRRITQRHLPGSQPAAGPGGPVVGRARAHERRLARLVALHHGAGNPGRISGIARQLVELKPWNWLLIRAISDLWFYYLLLGPIKGLLTRGSFIGCFPLALLSKLPMSIMERTYS